MYDYVKQLRWAKLKVGIMVTIAIGLVFVVVMFAGSIERVFAPKVGIFATFTDIKGLREGSPVWFSGVEIGSVKSISFNTQRQIMVEMMVSSESVKFLKEDSDANILTLGLLGDKYIEITPGSGGAAALRPGGVITGQTVTEIQDVVRASQDSIVKITEFISILEGIILKIEKGEGTLSKFLKDPDIYENLKATTKETEGLIRDIRAGKGTMGKLLTDDALYRDLVSSANDIRLFAQNLRESKGTVYKLVNDPTLYDRFQKASEDLESFTQRLSASQGTVNMLINDRALYDNISAASGKLVTLLDRIERGEGLAGSLVKDDELAQELRTTLSEMNVLIRDIRENPGRYFKFSIF